MLTVVARRYGMFCAASHKIYRQQYCYIENKIITLRHKTILMGKMRLKGGVLAFLLDVNLKEYTITRKETNLGLA